jgi:putative resolvase
MHTGLAGAARTARGRRLVVGEDGTVAGVLAGGMIGVLTWLCARRYDRRPARDRALTAAGCARRDIGPRAMARAGAGGGAG